MESEQFEKEVNLSHEKARQIQNQFFPYNPKDDEPEHTPLTNLEEFKEEITRFLTDEVQSDAEMLESYYRELAENIEEWKFRLIDLVDKILNDEFTENDTGGEEESNCDEVQEKIMDAIEDCLEDYRKTHFLC